ncbi:MAG: hypothetical protein AB7P00_42505 [Sandaracinaceae bacterium]
MSTFGSLEEIATHLGVRAVAGDPPRVAWRRSDASPVVDLYWDAARGLVWLRAPLAVDVARFDRRDLAVAVANTNATLEVFGIEYDADVAFVSHVFLDAQGGVSFAAIDRLIRAVDDCAERAAVMVAQLAPRPQGT